MATKGAQLAIRPAPWMLLCWRIPKAARWKDAGHSYQKCQTLDDTARLLNMPTLDEAKDRQPKRSLNKFALIRASIRDHQPFRLIMSQKKRLQI